MARGKPFKDISGLRSGLLTAVRFAKREKRTTYWHCRCACGNEKILGYPAITGKKTGTRSCGCLKEKRVHNMSDTTIYNTWQSMKARCSGDHEHRKRYRDRGITVCKEWLDSFPTFYRDMGDRPPGMTLDRIDNNRGYYKENCQWSSPKKQGRNRIDTKLNEDIAKQIREDTSSSNQDLADKYGVSTTTIRDVKKRRTWREDED